MKKIFILTLCLLIPSLLFGATNFPGSLDSYGTKGSGDTIAEGHINDPQDAIEAIEAKVGTGASTPADGKVFIGTGAGTSAWDVVPVDAGGSRIVQIVNTQSGAVATGTTVLPLDDTIPQNTEGDEYMTLAITPTSATNKLKIEVVCSLAHSASTRVVAALFQDTTANALAAAVQTPYNGAEYPAMVTFSYYMTSGTTSETTFKVRGGGKDSGTTTFNGKSGARIFGGITISSITITEIAV